MNLNLVINLLKKRKLLYIALIQTITACGSSNLFSFAKPDAGSYDFDALISQGNVYVDAGDFKSAEPFARRAQEINPQSEQAAVLLGNVLLGLAGVGAFGMAKSLVSDSKTTQEGESGGDDAILGALSERLDLSDETVLKLGEIDDAQPDLPVLVPHCAERAREQIENLTLLKDAVVAVCPFVDSIIRLQDEPRHQCESITRPRSLPSQVHFIWALAHIGEAVTFYKGLTYPKETQGDANIVQRMKKLGEIQVDDLSQIDSFVGEIETLQNIVEKVLPIGEFCSEEYPTTQMKALLNDLVSTNQGFDRMVGLPDKITKSLAKFTEKIDKVRTAGGSSGDQLAELKKDFVNKAESTLKDKLNSLDEQYPDLDAAKKEQICDSYSNIIGGGDAPEGSEDAVASLPSLCSNE